MKKSLPVAALFVLLHSPLFPVPSHGDVLPGTGTGPKTGDAIYLEEGLASTQVDTGFQFGGGYGFGLDRNLYLVLSTQYYLSSKNYSASYPATNANTVTATFDVWTVLANLRMNFTDRDNPVVFYGIAGLGPGFLMRGASPYFSATSVLEPMSRLGIGIDIRLFKRVSLSLEEGFVFQIAGLPFNPYVADNNLGSPDYPPVSIGVNLEPF